MRQLIVKFFVGLTKNWDLRFSKMYNKRNKRLLHSLFVAAQRAAIVFE